MLCENCKIKDATSMAFSDKFNRNVFLCGKCYKNINTDLALDDFANFEANKIKVETKCLNCGTTLNEFNTLGCFGCEKCYISFKDYINNNLLPLFKDKKYDGKKPENYYFSKKIKDLEQMIEICLKNGDFAKATKFGKELSALKEGNYDKL